MINTPSKMALETVSLSDFKVVGTICGMIDLCQTLLYSFFLFIVADTPSDSSVSGISTYFYCPTGERYPLRDGDDYDDWFWSLAMILAQVLLLTVGLVKLCQATRKDVTLNDWQQATKHWMILKSLFIFLAIISGLGNPLQFYVPGCLILYTLAVNLSALCLVLGSYKRQTKMNEGLILPV